MDQRLRLATAAAVMLLGLGIAWFFRRPAGEGDVPVAVQSDSPVLRKQPDRRSSAVGELSPGVAQASPLPPAPAAPQRAAATIVTPADRLAPPPELPVTYPRSDQAASMRWGASMGEMLPETASAPPTHRIIDGDSLALLAERYLGSASRAMEIFEANRNVPERPEILPMGVELKIPRDNQAASRAP